MFSNFQQMGMKRPRSPSPPPPTSVQYQTFPDSKMLAVVAKQHPVASYPHPGQAEYSKLHKTTSCGFISSPRAG